MVEQRMQIQLALIQEMTHLLTAAEIPHWLVGGWAVDFLVGRVTRTHHDIDWSIWKGDRERVADLLGQAGYARRDAGYPQEQDKYIKRGQNVTCFFLQSNAEGQIINPGRFAHWPWPDGSFTTGHRAELRGVHCPVVSVVGQLDAKENQPGGPQRDVDIADIIELRKVLGRQAR